MINATFEGYLATFSYSSDDDTSIVIILRFKPKSKSFYLVDKSASSNVDCKWFHRFLNKCMRLASAYYVV